MRYLLSFLLVVAGALSSSQTVLSVWGAPQGPDSIAIAQAFEGRHPGVKVRMLGLGVGHMNPQKLLTAIVGGCSPDIVYQGRFNISDWASRGAFLPLDDFLQRDKSDPNCPRESDYYEAAWSESVYDHHVFGIPTEADDRALFWNRGLFREKRAVLEAHGLDWRRAPRTWSELLEYSKVLTEEGKVIGFIPNFGNAWLYLYSFQNEAPFLSPDGKNCTLATKEVAEALEFMKKGYEVVGGYAKATALQSEFRGGENDPFISGKLAMKIDGDWSIGGLTRYAPNMDFGVAPPPVPDDRYYRRGRFANVRDQFVTWTGGWCYAMPRGCPKPELAWEFIKFATSIEGRLIGYRAVAMSEKAQGRIYIPRIQGLKKANDKLLRTYKPADKQFADAIACHMSLMASSRVRPPTIVGQLLWDEHVRATEKALLGKATPMDSLRESQETVQRQLDTLQARKTYPVVPMGWISRIAFAVCVGLAVAAVILWRRSTLGPLAKSEAKWGLMCIAPWAIGFLVLTAEPMIASLFFSFTDYDVLSPPRWVGIRNYAEMVGPDRPNVLKAFENAAYLAGIGVPLGVMSGLAVALLLNAKSKGIRFYRTIYYLPAIVPVAASSVLWIWILAPDPKQGLANAAWMATIGQWMSLPPPGWLTAEAWAKPALILMGIWGAGSGMILWLAGLKGIPRSLYEAAEIDGAGQWKSFWSVTMPMLSPILFFNIVMGFIGAIQEFDRVYIMSSEGTNGPSDSLLVPAKYLFTNAFTYFKIGYASALAWTIFAVILLITLIQFRFAKRWVHEEAEA